MRRGKKLKPFPENVMFELIFVLYFVHSLREKSQKESNDGRNRDTEMNGML